MPELFSILSSDLERVEDVPITATTPGAPQTVVSLVKTGLPAGKYRLGYVWQATFGQRDRPLYFRLSGSFPDTAFMSNSASSNDALTINRSFSFHKEFGGGSVNIDMEMYIPQGDVSLDFCALSLERVG